MGKDKSFVAFKRQTTYVLYSNIFIHHQRYSSESSQKSGTIWETFAKITLMPALLAQIPQVEELGGGGAANGEVPEPSPT